MRSHLKKISNNLMVIDVDNTITYYTNIGFEIIDKFPEKGPAYWAYLQKDGVELFFQSTETLTKEFPELENQKQGGALTLWFQVENVFEWYEEIKSKTEVIRPFGITDYNGAQEFVIKDINGFILHFSDFDILAEINKRK